MKLRSLVPRELLLPFILITSCFAWWGLAHNMTDTLLAAFKKILSLSDFESSWIQVAFYGSYFCLAIPAALFIRKNSYKAGILLGLGLYILGALMFYPASQLMSYSSFLIALYILAGGLSILETSANPYIIALGPPETGTMRLNLAQSFNPMGSIMGIFLSKYFILSNLNQAESLERSSMDASQLASIQTSELEAVMGPYVGIAIILALIWLAVFFTRMPTRSDNKSSSSFKEIFSRLIQNKNYVAGIAAQFFYVGAQIGVWSYTIRYAMQELTLNEADAADYYLASLIVFAISRFVFTAIMKFVSPRKLISLMSSLAIVLCLVVIFKGGMAGVISLIGISGCMSLMFPTIFGIAVEGLGEDTKIAGSGLIMAILGGAVLTMIQGRISDLSGIQMSYFVPLTCFLVVSIYGYASRRLA